MRAQPTKSGKRSSRGSVLEMLEQRIRGGAYPPGSWLPTERSLSSEFTADRSVVRAALDHLAQIGLIERERGCRPRVKALEKPPDAEVGHLPEDILVRTIAVVLPQHDADHASREILRGLMETLNSQPTAYRMLMFDTNLRTASRSALEAEACKAIEQEGIAGAIVWPSLDEGSVAQWQEVAAQGHPIVFVDRHDDAVPCDFVGIDNYTAAREAVEYLIGLGHSRIAHLTNDEQVSSVLERAAGYRDAMRAAGIVGELSAPWIIPLGRAYPWTEDFVTHCIQAADPPTAVFAVNDCLAYRLIASLEKRGVKVPGQISVIGFDDDDRYSPRPALLTTVRQPFERIGQRAAMLLLRHFAEAPKMPLTYRHILLPTQLIGRHTCQPLHPSSIHAD
jgi:DNA-binding LacI/PurR family transcriptional regulator